jgi:nicotinate-nucleotide adenylyltransferase
LSRSNRIGLYGGTFDPIHNGHLYVITELLERDVVDQIILILGTDAHAAIDKWHRSDELKKLVEVLVIDRPDFPGSPTLDIDALNISATQARAGDFDLLPPAVVTYIKERGLYASK